MLILLRKLHNEGCLVNNLMSTSHSPVELTFAIEKYVNFGSFGTYEKECM